MTLAQEGELNPLIPHPVEIVFALGLLVLALLVVVLLVRRRRSAARGREARIVSGVRWAGIALGAAVALHQLAEGRPLPSEGLGIDGINAAILFGLVTLLAVVLGEVVVRPRFDSGPRRADLRPRRIRDFLPGRLTGIVALLTAGALALCTFTWLVASPDDMGRSGRALVAACSATSSSSRGPFPGSFYVVPYAVGVLVALLVGGAAAWQVARRPLGGTPAQADEHRRVSMQAIVGAVGVVVAAPMVGMAFFAGNALTLHTCPSPGWQFAGWLAIALCVLSLAALVLSLLALLAPAPSPAAPRGSREQGSREQEKARG